MVENRRHLRYRIETSHLAQARFKGVTGEREVRPVLISNVSYSGCNLIAIAEAPEVAAGDEITLQFDTDDYADVEVVRIEVMTSRALILGCRFQD